MHLSSKNNYSLDRENAVKAVENAIRRRPDYVESTATVTEDRAQPDKDLGRSDRWTSIRFAFVYLDGPPTEQSSYRTVFGNILPNDTSRINGGKIVVQINGFNDNSNIRSEHGWNRIGFIYEGDEEVRALDAITNFRTAGASGK